MSDAALSMQQAEVLDMLGTDGVTTHAFRRQTLDALVRRGFAEYVGGYWVRLTAAGLDEQTARRNERSVILYGR